jgi:hypothetical protein
LVKSVREKENPNSKFGVSQFGYCTAVGADRRITYLAAGGSFPSPSITTRKSGTGSTEDNVLQLPKRNKGQGKPVPTVIANDMNIASL